MMDVDLRDLDAFATVARARNFRRAAREQRVSVSSLSQRLRALEEHLGVRLLNRTTRSVGLTEAGELLLARVAPAIGDVREALDRVRGLRDVPSGRLRINAPPPAIDLVIAPMIAPFLAAYPKIDLEIVADSSFVDIVDAGFDAGVRYGEHLAQDMIALSLGPPQRYTVVAAPDYVAQHGRPKHPKDLLAHPAIRTRFSNGVMPDWEFEKAGRAVKLAPPARLIATCLPMAMRSSVCSMTGAQRFRDRFFITPAGASRRQHSRGSSPLSENGGSGQKLNSRRSVRQDDSYSMLGSTRSGGLWLSRKVLMLMITFSPISTRPSIVAEPICGSSVTFPVFASRTSFGLTAGSCS
jgi:DNA-binding transcriptional LysR family regulator